MKKNKQPLLKWKSFKKDPRKEYMRKYRIYPICMYSRLDRWLKKMSLLGWHIVHSGLFSFLFEKGEPAEKEYFTYYTTAPYDAKYSILSRYPFLEKTYGVKKKKSKINSNESKIYLTVEVDLKRIDIQNNIG